MGQGEGIPIVIHIYTREVYRIQANCVGACAFQCPSLVACCKGQASLDKAVFLPEEVRQLKVVFQQYSHQLGDLRPLEGSGPLITAFTIKCSVWGFYGPPERSFWNTKKVLQARNQNESLGVYHVSLLPLFFQMLGFPGVSFSTSSTSKL